METREVPLSLLRVAERTFDQVRAEDAYVQARLTLARHGFLHPLLYSSESMIVIDKAHRLVAALDLGMATAPAVALTEAERLLWWAATLLNKEGGVTGPTAAIQALERLAEYGQLTGVGTGIGEQRPFVCEEAAHSGGPERLDQSPDQEHNV